MKQNGIKCLRTVLKFLISEQSISQNCDVIKILQIMVLTFWPWLYGQNFSLHIEDLTSASA